MFEIFENDGGLFGRDWDYWFRAQAELRHPVHLNIADSDDTLTVRAEVPGFKPNELEVSLRLAISGKKETCGWRSVARRKPAKMTRRRKGSSIERSARVNFCAHLICRSKSIRREQRRS